MDFLFGTSGAGATDRPASAAAANHAFAPPTSSTDDNEHVDLPPSSRIKDEQGEPLFNFGGIFMTEDELMERSTGKRKKAGPPQFVSRLNHPPAHDPDAVITHTSPNGLHGGKVYAPLQTYDSKFLADQADFLLQAADAEGDPVKFAIEDPYPFYLNVLDICERIDTDAPNTLFHFHVDVDFNDTHLRAHPTEIRRLLRNAVWSALPDSAPIRQLRIQARSAMKRKDDDNQHITFFGLLVNRPAAIYLHSVIMHALRTRFGDIPHSHPMADDQRYWHRIVDSGYNGLRMLGAQKRRNKEADTEPLRQNVANVYCLVDEEHADNRQWPPSHQDLIMASIMHLPGKHEPNSSDPLYASATFYKLSIAPKPSYYVIDAKAIVPMLRRPAKRVQSAPLSPADLLGIHSPSARAAMPSISVSSEKTFSGGLDSVSEVTSDDFLDWLLDNSDWFVGGLPAPKLELQKAQSPLPQPASLSSSASSLASPSSLTPPPEAVAVAPSPSVPLPSVTSFSAAVISQHPPAVARSVNTPFQMPHFFQRPQTAPTPSMHPAHVQASNSAAAYLLSPIQSPTRAASAYSLTSQSSAQAVPSHRDLIALLPTIMHKVAKSLQIPLLACPSLASHLTTKYPNTQAYQLPLPTRSAPPCADAHPLDQYPGTFAMYMRINTPAAAANPNDFAQRTRTLGDQVRARAVACSPHFSEHVVFVFKASARAGTLRGFAALMVKQVYSAAAQNVARAIMDAVVFVIRSVSGLLNSTAYLDVDADAFSLDRLMCDGKGHIRLGTCQCPASVPQSPPAPPMLRVSMALRVIAEFALALLGLDLGPFLLLVDQPTLLPDLRKLVTNALRQLPPTLLAQPAAAHIARVIAYTLDYAHRLARDAPFQVYLSPFCTPIVNVDLVKLLEAGLGGTVPLMREARERVVAHMAAAAGGVSV